MLKKRGLSSPQLKNRKEIRKHLSKSAWEKICSRPFQRNRESWSQSSNIALGKVHKSSATPDLCVSNTTAPWNIPFLSWKWINFSHAFSNVWHFEPWRWELASKSCPLFKVFHHPLFIIRPPVKLFHKFQDAKPFLLLLFQVCYWHLQALTGAFSQLPLKTPIVPRRLTFPLGHQLKSITFIPIVLAVIGAVALCQTELVGFSSHLLLKLC